MCDERNSSLTTVDEYGNIRTMKATGKILNFNFDDMCVETNCSEKYTQFITLTVNGLELFLPVCDTHAHEMGEFSKKYWKSICASEKVESEPTGADKVIQIMPADGWYAKFEEEYSDYIEYKKLIAFALFENKTGLRFMDGIYGENPWIRVSTEEHFIGLEFRSESTAMSFLEDTRVHPLGEVS